ncbi:MAG: hypothetical protein ABSC15_03030 [Terriglobales bacterium]|jgi:hypothetical protein
MPISLTVPDGHKDLAPPATTASPIQIQETNPQVTNHSKNVSAAKLRQKNRKAKQFRVTTVLDLSIEAGTVYLISGFNPDADAQTWVCVDVVHSLSGKGGSTTKAVFQHAITEY